MALVKTTLELPEDLMREVRILAASENRRMKDIIAESLRRTLRIGEKESPPSVRDIPPLSVGRTLDVGHEDRLKEMLDERGHRYWNIRTGSWRSRRGTVT